MFLGGLPPMFMHMFRVKCGDLFLLESSVYELMDPEYLGSQCESTGAADIRTIEAGCFTRTWRRRRIKCFIQRRT